VAKTVICPACQSKGSIPDGAAAARIRCPKCGQSFDVRAATQSQSSTTGPVKRPAGAKPAAGKKSAFSDLEDVQPLAPVSGSAYRRAPGAAGPAGGHGSGKSSNMILAVVGIGGLAVVLLVAILVVVMTQGGGGKPQVAKADTSEAAEPVVPPVAPPAAVPAVTTAAASTDSAASQTLDHQDIVRKLKEATVYVKHKVAGKTLGSGSGFVIEVRGDTVLIATNSHVAVPDLDDVPSRLLPKGSKLEIDAVFRSGQGPQQEQTVPAQVLAFDSSEEVSTDLAILLASGVKRPPKPIDVQNKSDTTEGVSYTGAGFPYGGMLGKVNDNQGNPSVTIIGGRIAALRRDEHGHVDVFQVDGALHGGNSGGPIVEEKTGKLIGIVAAGLMRAETIGFLVPADHLRRMLGGRIGNLDLTLKALQDNSANLEVKAAIVDPKQKVQSVLVHVAPASAGKPSPNSDGTWSPLPNTSAVELQRDSKTPTATGVVQVALSGEGAAKRKILIQTAHKDMAGQLVYSKPKEVELPQKPGRVAVSTRNLRMLKTVQRKSITMLGPLVDPEKDCKLVKDEDNMKISIEIPGGKVRSIAPYIVQRLRKNRPLHNAPMTLIDVEGDLAAIVEVTGEMRAGDKLPKDRQGNDIPFTFNGAGLVLYQDKDNFVRLERTAGVSVTNLTPIHKILFEVVKDGKQVPNQIYIQVPEGPVYLLLMRRKGRIIVGASPNLETPPVPFRGIEFDLSTKLKVGLSASNISAKSFTAHFENFALINSDTQMDAIIGDQVPDDKPDDEKKKEG
jgi:S1-C subfamily serine protease/regulation of enolase protein 1 (concanavalin A-like superfamily)